MLQSGTNATLFRMCSVPEETQPVIRRLRRSQSKCCSPCEKRSMCGGSRRSLAPRKMAIAAGWQAFRPIPLSKLAPATIPRHDGEVSPVLPAAMSETAKRRCCVCKHTCQSGMVQSQECAMERCIRNSHWPTGRVHGNPSRVTWWKVEATGTNRVRDTSLSMKASPPRLHFSAQLLWSSQGLLPRVDQSDRILTINSSHSSVEASRAGALLVMSRVSFGGSPSRPTGLKTA